MGRDINAACGQLRKRYVENRRNNYAVLWKSDIGCVRTENQDTIFYTDQPIGMLRNLYIVADGMGGHNAGAYASRYVTDKLVENARKSTGWDVVAFLKNVLQQLNYDLLQKEEPKRNIPAWNHDSGSFGKRRNIIRC